jgi:Ser-tRNA(Ala) deacylase AlaX
MTELLYFTDCYVKEFDAVIISANENLVELDKTAFYPSGGGQPNDKGEIICDNQRFEVKNVFKVKGKIWHAIDREGLKVGDRIRGIIDWDRRYKLMRMHTAAHIISEIIRRETGALITGNQLDTEKSRIDYNLEKFDREKIKVCIEKANEIAKQALPVRIYFMDRAEALKIPNITKLASKLPPTLPKLRIVEIVSLDIQADGGTHVKNTKEIGRINLIKMENKGKNNRRIYYSLD